MTKHIDLIGVQVDLGACGRGVNLGPGAIRLAGLAEGIQKLGIEFTDKSDLLPMVGGASTENMRNYEAIIELNHRVYSSVEESLENGHMPIVLGGDHSLAAGSVPAIARHF